MTVTDDILSEVVGFNVVWGVVHLIYFGMYYSRYSACFHKLSSVDGLEKTGLYEQELIDVTRENTWKRIKKLERFCYIPIPFITGFHLLIFYLWESTLFSLYYMSVFYIMIGAFVFIFLANKTQGIEVVRNTGGPDGTRNPFI